MRGPRPLDGIGASPPSPRGEQYAFPRVDAQARARRRLVCGTARTAQSRGRPWWNRIYLLLFVERLTWPDGTTNTAARWPRPRPTSTARRGRNPPQTLWRCRRRARCGALPGVGPSKRRRRHALERESQSPNSRRREGSGASKSQRASVPGNRRPSARRGRCTTWTRRPRRRRGAPKVRAGPSSTISEHFQTHTSAPPPQKARGQRARRSRRCRLVIRDPFLSRRCSPLSPYAMRCVSATTRCTPGPAAGSRRRPRRSRW
mmetsp:Transcript_27877/g.93799  ORF Transcript_27877/g.93799 Transcript_27877/m.93799 type:complete len:260 (-) Transcript_27877:311-1090(-)